MKKSLLFVVIGYLCALQVHAATADFDLRIESAVQVSFQTQAGRFYALQTSPATSPPTWTQVGPIIKGDGMRREAGFLTGLSPQMIYRVYQLTLSDGLVAYYPFNGNAKDETGNANDGSVASGAALTTNRFGVINSAYSFNGVGGYIQIPESTAFDSADFTISMWFLPLRVPATADFLISKGNINFEIHTAPKGTGGNKIRFLPRSSALSGWDTVAPSAYQVNKWNHLIAIYQPTAGKVKLFMNGQNMELVGGGAVIVVADNTSPARLGRRTDSTFPFLGSIDSVRIYNRALTDQEATDLFLLDE